MAMELQPLHSHLAEGGAFNPTTRLTHTYGYGYQPGYQPYMSRGRGYHGYQRSYGGKELNTKKGILSNRQLS